MSVDKTPATVLPFRSWPQENELVVAYYVLLSMEPSYKDASPATRSLAINRIRAGFHAARQGFAAVDDAAMRGHGQALALMDYDLAEERKRERMGGF